jgi:hypothetical protein
MVTAVLDHFWPISLFLISKQALPLGLAESRSWRLSSAQAAGEAAMGTRRAGGWQVVIVGVGLALLLHFHAFSTAAEARKTTHQRISPKDLRRDVDVSPLPNYRGDFVSLGLDGVWRQPERAQPFIRAAAAASGEPPANCSREAIIHYAWQAPAVFEKDKKGLLYGVETHTAATRVGNTPGLNSCALVVYAILKKAGCGWLKYTADAKAVYDMALARGWRPTDKQEGGCIVAWNSRSDGKRPAIGTGEGGRVLFRHVGITTGSWLSVDNTAFLSRPLPFITWRPYRYRQPMFLCPPSDAAH